MNHQDWGGCLGPLDRSKFLARRNTLIKAASFICLLLSMTCASADTVTAAIWTMNETDKAADRCDALAMTVLLDEAYKGIVTVSRKDSTNDVYTLNKGNAQDLANNCRANHAANFATKRKIRKAELAADHRVELSGDFQQGSNTKPGETWTKGRFMTVVLCDSVDRCRIKTDVVVVQVLTEPGQLKEQ